MSKLCEIRQTAWELRVVSLKLKQGLLEKSIGSELFRDYCTRIISKCGTLLKLLAVNESGADKDLVNTLDSAIIILTSDCLKVKLDVHGIDVVTKHARNLAYEYARRLVDDTLDLILAK